MVDKLSSEQQSDMMRMNKALDSMYDTIGLDTSMDKMKSAMSIQSIADSERSSLNMGEMFVKKDPAWSPTRLIDWVGGLALFWWPLVIVYFVGMGSGRWSAV